MVALMDYKKMVFLWSVDFSLIEITLHFWHEKNFAADYKEY